MTSLARPPRDVVVVSGPDALSYLQNLVSQDLEGLPEGRGANSLLLTPQGKLDVVFSLVRVGDGAWLVCESGYGARLVESLNRFKIRVAVEIALDERLAVLAFRDAGAAAGDARPDGVYELPARWSGVEAIDLVGHTEALDGIAERLLGAGATEWSEDDYEAARIQAGVPRQGLDLDERTIPQEAFLERDAVSFTKGCFLGQELVCRIDARGHVNRYLRSLTAVGGEDLPVGAEIVAGDRTVGSVTSSAGPVALGYVRREVEPPAEVMVRWDGGEVLAAVSDRPGS
jgi:folate-binding protein YgfZ